MKIAIIMAMALTFSLTGTAQGKSFYDFTVKTIDGSDYSLAQLKGKKVLVVNVASNCGLTPQYQTLQLVYDLYKDMNFVVLAFPANDFAGQEPGTNEEIKEFCTVNYDVNFPMMAKISVKGKDMAPLYHWLTEKSGNGKANAPVQWNFQKFLIDEQGNWVGMVPPQEQPNSDAILGWIETSSK